MIFIVYAHTDRASIKTSMGAADYSYYFVLKSYIPVLQKLGTVIQIDDPEIQLNAVCDAAKLLSQSCIFLQFSPPHKIFPDYKCLSVSVFAWEYTTIPSDVWGGLKWNDWRKGLSHQGAAITHSSIAKAVLKESMGNDYLAIDVASPLWDKHKEILAKEKISNTLRFKGILFDSKNMLFDVEKSSIEDIANKVSIVGDCEVELRGVVYTSVFCPSDGRKNWEDMISSFCYELRDKTDVTLVLKLIHSNQFDAIKEVIPEIRRNVPFKCRVVLIAGYLPTNTYHELIRLTDYVVNSSHGEGQCLPLMEFMSAGVPAIAPIHTAMADYMSDNTGFVVESSYEWTYWPHDPRLKLKTMRSRINWMSLRHAYRDSYTLRLESPCQYEQLQNAATESLKNYASKERAYMKLTDFFTLFLRNHSMIIDLKPMGSVRESIFYVLHFCVKVSSPSRFKTLFGRKKERLLSRLRRIKKVIKDFLIK
jgi:glycosyltransferase involved in cell wall biosynthesis